MKVLFIGGTGTISSACTELALKSGIDLYHFNRGQSHRKFEGVKNINGDIRDVEESKKKLNDMYFDVVVDWICFTEEHAKSDVELFSGITGQFMFISSASAYKKPVDMLPITEKTPLENPFWEYSRNKIACENILKKAHDENKMPVTIVRPSHTYDRTLIPFEWGYTVIDRILHGKKVIIHGDGTSLWVMTHNTDFARGFNGLFGKKEALGEAFHITGDELLNWNLIFRLFAEELGKELDAIHISSDFINTYDNKVGSSLLGDKSHSVIFDNSKIKKMVPEFKQTVMFKDGVKEIVSWYKTNPSWCIKDEVNDKIIELIVYDYMRCMK